MDAVKPSKRRTQLERREEAESKLIEAAVDLIAEKGLEGVTLLNVAKAAGYSRGLPVHYFGVKENLLASVMQYLVNMHYNALAQLPEAPRGLPRLEQVIRQYAKPHTAGVRALSLLMAYAAVNPTLNQAIRKLNASTLKTIKHEIQAGIEVGNIRKDANLDLSAAVIFSFMRGQLTFSTLEPEFNREEIEDEFIASLSARLSPSSAQGITK